MKPIKEPRRNQNIKLTMMEILPSNLNKNPGKSGIAINKKQPILLLHLFIVIHPTITINKLKTKPNPKVHSNKFLFNPIFLT